MKPNQKLYVVVRGDLGYGHQMAQAIHACREFAEKFPELEQEWYKTSNHICVLVAPSAQDLIELRLRGNELGLKSCWFVEPALDFSITAVAFEPSDKTSEFLQFLPLAGKCANSDNNGLFL